MKKTFLILFSILIIGTGSFFYLTDNSFISRTKAQISSIINLKNTKTFFANEQTAFEPSQITNQLPQKTPPEPQINLSNYCSKDTIFSEENDKIFCSQPPKINRFRMFEIDLSDNKIIFYENGLIKKIFPLAYQAPYGKWFQTPTGYFQLGVKKMKFMSSVVSVYMENAVQLYEDFFIHGIPYYPDGTKVTSQFSGGCIRLEDKVADQFYKDTQTGDGVVSYLTLNKIQLKEGFSSPINPKGFWIRQRFNSPLKANWKWAKDKKENYIQHAGLDLAPYTDTQDKKVYSIYKGIIEKIHINGQQDAGLGNSIIIKHQINNTIVYSLYGHLDSINSNIKEGDQVTSGQAIGIVGNTGYGCNFWKVGDDGCDKQDTEDDIHLHLEIKTAPILESPIQAECEIDGHTSKICIGYTPKDPTQYGYFDPLTYIYSTF